MTRTTLAKLGDIFLDTTSTADQLSAALLEFSDYCSALGGVEPERCFDAFASDSHLDSGVAISPEAAAHCVSDERRTVTYLRAVERALKDLQRCFPGQPLEVLYAGCGPYATLLLPLLHRFEPAALSVTLLDIHAQSLRSLQQIIDASELASYRLKLLQADATRYSHPAPLQLVVAETMQKALEGEPQVAVDQQLRPQLSAGGLFIPEAIEVSLALRGDGVEYPLGVVLDLSAEPQLQPVAITLPDAGGLAALEGCLLTRIRVYEGMLLGEGEAEITLPRPMPELAPLRAGQRWQLAYHQGSYPCFSAQLLSG